MSIKFFVLGMLAYSLVATANAQTVQDYNQALITNGVSWKAGSYTYYPSFYTGFAPRVEDANRIHFHLSRGNQIRLSAPLDEYTVLTYLFNLTKREALFEQVAQEGLIKLEQQNQMALFRSVLNSDRYQIHQLTEKAIHGTLSREQLYDASLKIVEELNPGRVFKIRLNISAALQNWQTLAQNFSQARGSVGLEDFITKNPQKTITLVNSLVWGRVNLISVTPAVKEKLIETLQVQSDITAKAIDLFNLATEGRYTFKVLRNGSLQPSLYQNAQGQWTLEYPEFTAIYPNGSVKDYTDDRDGNRIPVIREVGALTFIDRTAHDVDHIRSESFYGYIPKMDYTGTGNGIHNPAVRTSLKSSVYKSLYQDLNIPTKDDTLWIVARGGVSHGCTRMAAGHALEVRDIFPSSNARMKKVKYFGNASQDYDLYDVAGTGQLQVMGVQYYIAYDIAADSGEGYREGAGLIASSLNRDAFYNVLYGKNQFRYEGGSYVFMNPYISQFIADKASAGRAAAFSLKMTGDFKLYEQAYEKDKMQFFSMSKPEMAALSESNDHKSLGKQLVRIFGRATGCGPFKAEFSFCGEDQFDKEFATLKPQITKVK